MEFGTQMHSWLKSVEGMAPWIGLREVKETHQYRVVRNGKLDSSSLELDHGVMVEVLVDGQFVYYGTNDLTERGIRNACEKAIELSKSQSTHQLGNFSTQQRPMSTGKFRSAGKKGFDSASLGELTDLLIETSERMKISDKIVNSEAMGILVESQMRYLSTNGSDFSNHSFMVTPHLKATAQNGSEIQNRTWERFLQGGLEIFNRDTLFENADRISRESLELLEAEECPEGLYDLLITPDQVYLQVHESIGHPLELDRILGDERNYAGWSFVKKDDFGKLQYGSELLNITFDPHVENEFASYDFDDIGTPAKKEFIIKEGKLLRALGGLESQSRSGVLGIANSRSSSWNRAPIDRMANINLEAGNSSFNDMVSKMEKGIIMQTNRSWSIDDFRNKFQFGCEYGQLVENGKITKTLKNPNYRGISTPFWNNLTGVGDQSTFSLEGSLYCGKGEPNQAIRVGHGVPACLFKDIEVFGGC